MCKGSCRRRRLRDCRATNGRPYNHDWQYDRIRRGGHRPPAPRRSGLPPLSQGRWHLRALRANDGEVVKIVTFKPLSRGKPRQLPFHKGSLWAGDQWSPAGPMRASAPTFRHLRSDDMKTVTIYTDGACSGNPGPGGCSGGAANLSLWENAAKGGKRGSERSNFAAAS